MLKDHDADCRINTGHSCNCWMKNISKPSQIQCTICDGSGKVSVEVTCKKCGGTGWRGGRYGGEICCGGIDDITVDCEACGGTGLVEKEE